MNLPGFASSTISHCLGSISWSIGIIIAVDEVREDGGLPPSKGYY
jgi:hypothetical protein